MQVAILNLPQAIIKVMGVACRKYPTKSLELNYVANVWHTATGLAPRMWYPLGFWSKKWSQRDTSRTRDRVFERIRAVAGQIVVRRCETALTEPASIEKAK
jgi:hypothetical protein